MSLTDALTALANCRKLLSDLAAIVDEQRPVLLMLLDLNGFKNYNDSYGHVVGDSLLERLGSQLRAAVEPLATANRLGGDEFCRSPHSLTRTPSSNSSCSWRPRYPRWATRSQLRARTAPCSCRTRRRPPRTRSA
jgi:hypothetical protein